MVLSGPKRKRFAVPSNRTVAGGSLLSGDCQSTLLSDAACARCVSDCTVSAKLATATRRLGHPAKSLRGSFARAAAGAGRRAGPARLAGVFVMAPAPCRGRHGRTAAWEKPMHSFDPWRGAVWRCPLMVLHHDGWSFHDCFPRRGEIYFLSISKAACLATPASAVETASAEEVLERTTGNACGASAAAEMLGTAVGVFGAGIAARETHLGGRGHGDATSFGEVIARERRTCEPCANGLLRRFGGRAWSMLAGFFCPQPGQFAAAGRVAACQRAPTWED
jgi:hypothetical protein